MGPNYSKWSNYSASLRLPVQPTELYRSCDLVNSLCKYVPKYTLCTRLYLNLGHVRTGMHAMVHRIGASGAAAQLHLTGRPTGQKWSAASTCRSHTSTGPATAEWSAQQVGSTRWPRAGGGAAVGAVLVLGGAVAPLGCTDIYTVICTCRFRAATTPEGGGS